jgi:hypothetical protein
MNERNSNTFLRFAALGSKIVFGLTIVIILALAVFNYFDWGGNERDVTVRGDITLIEKNWKPMKTKQYNLKDSIGLSAIILQKKKAFVRLDYSDLGKALSLRNVTSMVLHFLTFAIWLMVLYQVMKIINAVYNDQVFGLQNINRIRWIALIFLVAPIISGLHDWLFALIVHDKIEIPDHYVVSNSFRMNRWNVIKGASITIVLMVIAEVIKKGMHLKSENDLTV